MAVEIERKFLVRRELWRPKEAGIAIRQGYLASDAERTVRVRTWDEQAYLTIKGKNQGIRRLEFEYEIPFSDAQELLELCEQPVISKRRYLEKLVDKYWEIDVFEGENEGLILAEVELPSEDAEIVLPKWAGPEVSDDIRYYNSYLFRHPYRLWKS